jgi:hypothetical protein
MELADQQVQENEGSGGLSGAEIPAAADVPAQSSAPAEKPAKEAKLSIREQITKSVEAARVEEAKRARAAGGKFTKLEAGAAEKPATAPEIPKPEAQAQPEASKPVGPPSAWKAIWENLSPEAQALAVKREADVEKGFSEYRTKTAQLAEISQVFEPIRAVLQQNGITSDVQAVKQLAQWEGAFRNPATRTQAFHDLARTYGVDLATLVQSSSSAAPSNAQDIPDQLRPVLDQFGQVSQQAQQALARVQTWEEQQAAREITAFASNHPHYEAVRVQMGKLITAGLATNLDDAYQQAVKIHPEVSAKIAEEERTKAEQKAATERAEKLRAAQAAAVSPSPRAPLGAGASAPPGKKAGVRDSILSSISALREEQRA